MGDHDDLPLMPRKADTTLRHQGDRDTLLGADHQSLLASLPMVGDIFGHFRIEKYLGQGSSGCVFRAFDCELHRHFALKFVCNDPADNLVRTKIGFRRMMRVEHPNLARADQIHRSGNQIALSIEEIHRDTFANSLQKMQIVINIGNGGGDGDLLGDNASDGGNGGGDGGNGSDGDGDIC